MPSSPTPTRPSVRRDRAAAPAGFTLIELLTVVAIIGILATITFNVMNGVSRKQQTVRAQAELSAIRGALDTYKAQYGDYPHTSLATELFDALVGKRGPTNLILSTTGKASLVNLTKFTLSNPEKIDTIGANTLRDPWGKDYIYVYKAPASAIATWANPTPVLFSSGPDEKYAIPVVDSKGFPTSLNESDSLDNISTP